MKTKKFTHCSSRREEALTNSRLNLGASPSVQPAQPSAEPKTFQHFNASTLQRSPAFTLIELLVVIAIAVVIAGLLIAAGGAVVQKSNLNRAISERDQLEAAIDAYKAKYGFYPPGNALGGNAYLNAVTNQLFYELLGTQPAIASAGNTIGYATLDSGNYIISNTVPILFGVGTFMNCNKGSGDDAIPAKTFLGGLKAGEIASNGAPNGTYTFIATAATSDSVYTPMPGVFSLAGRPANPWRYMCPGTNNPNSYDLWVQVFVGNKTNLICNWAKQPQLNVPLP